MTVLNNATLSLQECAGRPQCYNLTLKCDVYGHKTLKIDSLKKSISTKGVTFHIETLIVDYKPMLA